MSKLFFVQSMGRSGTKFFAQLLNKAAGAIVQHEPWSETDLVKLPRSRQSQQDSHGYIAGYRRSAIKAYTFQHKPAVYGEVNSHLRYHTAALQDIFPQASFVHLVRDGRDVVRSLIPRGHYRDEYRNVQGRGHLFLRPNEGEQFADMWDAWGRFEKCCWLWADANHYLRKHIDYRVKAEDLWADYDVFAGMCDYIGIEIDEQAWAEAVDRPVNATKQHAVVHWNDWPEPMAKTFAAICGDEMEACGYELKGAYPEGIT